MGRGVAVGRKGGFRVHNGSDTGLGNPELWEVWPSEHRGLDE